MAKLSLRHSRILSLGLLLAACSTAPSPTPPANAAATQAAPKQNTNPQFTAFLQELKRDALSRGIDGGLYDRALGHIRLNPRVAELNASQPEFIKPIWDYLDSAVSDKRISDGVQQMQSFPDLLQQIETRFGVPREILVSIWGNETNYGRFMGSFNLFEALAPLAFEGRRTAFGRSQLLAALEVAQNGPFEPGQMKSSWAGAFGQTQFIPTSYLAHAVDFDGDGKKDIWNSVADALASAAQLLSHYGWQAGQPWLIEIRLPTDFPYAQSDLDTRKDIDQWRALGISATTGPDLKDLPHMLGASVILPAGASGPAFLVFDNFRALLKYNNAVSYGLAVSLLAQRIQDGPILSTPWPRHESPLLRQDRLDFQSALQQLGYDPGEIDGVLGRKARMALRAYQQARNIPADGFATKALLQRLKAEIAAPSN